MTPADLERFRRLAGMLGSEHVGERAAAALKCTELLKAAGLTWSSVSLPVEQPDVLAQRREAMGKSKYPSAQEMQRAANVAAREFDEAARKHNAAEQAKRDAVKAAWKERSYGADADGFEPGRK